MAREKSVNFVLLNGLTLWLKSLLKRTGFRELRQRRGPGVGLFVLAKHWSVKVQLLRLGRARDVIEMTGGNGRRPRAR